ncbi:MAG: DUF3429 domain-containing protein [Burkholderiales bacterium]|nr:DUF3429 domain-containing protein [Burkholderiales bacterium]MDE2275853.1 DUF3429 domain-containing protein [Burkholderiales bacterium]
MARRLGYAGLLPFIAGALLVWTVHDELRPELMRGLALYAAVIASFLGGIHWGLAMQAGSPSRHLVWGVLPALLAWPAAWMPPGSGLVLLGALLLAGYAVDRGLYAAAGAEAWLTLRFRLSAVAGLCCFIGAAGA